MPRTKKEKRNKQYFDDQDEDQTFKFDATQYPIDVKVEKDKEETWNPTFILAVTVVSAKGFHNRPAKSI